MKPTTTPNYDDFLSPSIRAALLREAQPVPGVPGLTHVGTMGGLETPEALGFLSGLYLELRADLAQVLNRRAKDRRFIDERTRALRAYNDELKVDFHDPDYKTVLGLEDGDGRIVIGPRQPGYFKRGGTPIAPIPAYLQGPHVTLFGPPDSAKLSINAMNAYHRRLKDEPAIVEELLATHTSVPKWGADDEDSKTPLREDLVAAGENLTRCFDGTLAVDDGKKYRLEKDKLSQPIKRFPGLALPSTFLFQDGEPVPLHLYDFALHLFRNWENERALCFYVPKLENEEEARYVHTMVATAEARLRDLHPGYRPGSVRLMVVLENPRAVFRAHEIIDELWPYFVGASLGWHDYLAATARLFKEDPNYRIPVKADPDIVIKYIRASHDLLAHVVGSRGGIKVGGMYGILPTTTDLQDPSYQVTLKGFIRDVVTQLKRDLTGFWVAHPDFVRLGLALVEAWKFHREGSSRQLEALVKALLAPEHHEAILRFIHGPDIPGLDEHHPLYARALIVADMKESTFIANNHPDEIRYNVFQSLQYLTDWLSGNGCVALPAAVGGVPVRVMDDLATAERSRWEVWHELRHGRFALEDFLRIVQEELHFIRKDLSDGNKIVQVKWDERTAKWYPVAVKLMTKLMTEAEPVEFATQYLLPFTIPSVRAAADPWARARELDPGKFALEDRIERFNHWFELCGGLRFATLMARTLATDLELVRSTILSFSKEEVVESARFHGDIGEGKKTLDPLATQEQARVHTEHSEVRDQLLALGQAYREKFGMKFLVSARGKTGQELLALLRSRLQNPAEVELANAREALWEITRKRLEVQPLGDLAEKLTAAFQRHGVKDAQLALSTGEGQQCLSFGAATSGTWFELASLSKTLSSALALEWFRAQGIPLSSPVNELFSRTSSSFRIPGGDKVTVRDLMAHTALNLHYVNGVPADRPMPPVAAFLQGNADYGYEPVAVAHPPGEAFHYSGGGFLVLEHLLGALAGTSVFELGDAFLNRLGITDLSFRQESLPGVTYARGYHDDGREVAGGRKMFPSFAAGCMGTASGMLSFLQALTRAHTEASDPGPLSHDTARLMLHGFDQGCMAFMGVKMGLGVFVGEAGPNKFAIHQGANDGFRCLYLHCFFGPDRGKGFVVLANADLKGVLFNAEVAQLLLRELKVDGVDFGRFKTQFAAGTLRPEEVVNTGYKSLVFDAFVPTRPEEIVDRGAPDPLAPHNLAVGARVLEVSDERFARAENLVSDHLPKFDPELFGKQGKIMDSWETVRHNLKGVDHLTLALVRPEAVRYVLLSTKYHFGNHAPVVRLEGLVAGAWREFLPRTELPGHAELRIDLERETEAFSQVRVSMYPDGGLTRLGLFRELPEGDGATFRPRGEARAQVYEEKIPHTVKPLSIKYAPSPEDVRRNLGRFRPGDEFDNASLALGARVLHATNEHYSPAVQVISPFAPINMFDGMESARSRTPGNYEEVVLALARRARIHRIEMDFSYFVNNNPLEVSVYGGVGEGWEVLVEKTNVKAFAGNVKTFEVHSGEAFETIKIRTWPDGGMNRFRAFSRLED